MLLAATAASLEGTRAMAGDLREYGLYYVCAVEGGVIVALFGLLVRSWYLRLTDVRQTLAEVLKHLNENTESVGSLSRVVEAKLPKARKGAHEDKDAGGALPGPLGAAEKHGSP